MKRFRLAFGLGLVPFLLFAGSARAAVFNCPAGDVACLISAINTANGTAAADTINLAAGTYSLAAVDNETDEGANGLPLITSRILIRGVGATETIIQRASGSGTPEFRIFQVDPSGNLELESLAIRNGRLGLELPSGGGAGIDNHGITRIADSVVADNEVLDFGGGGGGISNTGVLTLTRTRIQSNFAFPGGGVFNSGILTILDSTLNNNAAAASGGGMVQAGVAVITDSTFEENSAGFGGAMFTRESSDTTIGNSTIVHNGAIVDAIMFPASAAQGGGILAHGIVHINNSTITENRAETRVPEGLAAEGGGIHGVGTVELQNTILARNVSTVDDISGLPTPADGPDCFGPVTSLGNNLVGDPSDCTIPLLASDLTGDPGLGAFQDDGTPGNGHFPLLGTSQAVDAGEPASCTLTDQLGHSRIDGDGDGTVICDIGAIEFSPGAMIVNGLVSLAPLVTAFHATPVPGGPAGTYTIRATFTNESATPIHDPFFRVTTLTGGKLLLNADGGPGGVGAILTGDPGPDAILSPGESLTTEFVIGLQSRVRFTFLVDVLGVPGP